MSGKKFPYTLFITDKNLSLYNSNMISSSTKKSILENYHNQISNFVKEKNIKLSDVDNNNILNKINEIFRDNLINAGDKVKYEDFSKELLYYKYLLINIRENILVFNLVKTKIKDRILKNNLSYVNPLIIKNIDDSLIGYKRFFTEKIDIYNNNDKNIYIQAINNIFYGYRFNIGLPSVGSIYSFYENPSGTNIPEFIVSMLNYDDNFMDKFPLINQNIAETISSILLTKNESKLNNINNILDENLNNTNMNNNTKRNLENYFKGITIELRDIMVEPSSKYIKKDYIIPFKYINDKNIFEYQEKMSYRLDDDKSIKLLMMNNLNLLYSTMKSDGTFKIELTDTKIILCCFLFFTINLFYDVYKYYINSLNQTIIDLSDSRGKKFKDLNIEGGFDFIKKLNESLLNFKLILLNNFYELFQPSKISSNYYGMYKNKNGFFVPESRLLVEIEVLNKIYPFRRIDDSVKDNLKIIEDKESQKLIANFILFKQKDKDLYDVERYLDLGVFTYNDIITSRTLNIYYSFFENYEKIINFDLFIIDLLIKNFKERMPIECINQSLDTIKPNISTLNRTFLDNQKNTYRSIVKNSFVKLYNESMRKSAVYTSKYLKVESNLITSGKKSLEKEKETYSLIASMYYIRSEFINHWIQNIKDIRLKNQLTEEFNKIKKNINKLLAKKAKALKKAIDKSKKNNNSTRNNSIEIRIL
jgi:hypothetical protein